MKGQGTKRSSAVRLAHMREGSPWLLFPGMSMARATNLVRPVWGQGLAQNLLFLLRENPLPSKLSLPEMSKRKESNM